LIEQRIPVFNINYLFLSSKKKDEQVEQISSAGVPSEIPGRKSLESKANGSRNTMYQKNSGCNPERHNLK
jgi:hypothetical protein